MRNAHENLRDRCTVFIAEPLKSEQVVLWITGYDLATNGGDKDNLR
jgi:hypothetical protein